MRSRRAVRCRSTSCRSSIALRSRPVYLFLLTEVFGRWMGNSLADTAGGTSVDEPILSAREAKNVFATKLKEHGERLKEEGRQEEKRETPEPSRNRASMFRFSRSLPGFPGQTSRGCTRPASPCCAVRYVLFRSNASDDWQRALRLGLDGYRAPAGSHHGA